MFIVSVLKHIEARCEVEFKPRIDANER